MTTSLYRKKEYTVFLAFTTFVSILFFFGIYVPLAHTVWLSLLVGGTITWTVLTILIQVSSLHSLFRGAQRLFSLLAIGYGGIMLFAFFSFCQRVIFPDRSFIFLPVVFLLTTIYGAQKGLDPLERTAKFTSVVTAVLLFLTIISTTQKIWAEKDYVQRSLGDLFNIHKDTFLTQTVLITILLLIQAIVLFLTVEESCDSPLILRSIRKGLVPGVLCSSILYLIAAVALGVHSFEHLTYPIYDMLSLPGYAEYLDRTEFLMLIIFFFCESCKTIAVILSGRKLVLPQRRRAPAGGDCPQKAKKIHTA